MFILCISGGTYSLNSRSRDFLRNFSWQFYLLSGFLPEICRVEIAEETVFVLRFELERLISQHTTYSTTATSYLKIQISSRIASTFKMQNKLKKVWPEP